MDSEIPQRLRAARHFAGLTRAQVAAALELSESTYKESERGKRSTPRRERKVIAEVCRTPEWFIEGGWGNYPRATEQGEGGAPGGRRPVDLIPPEDRGGAEDEAEQA